MTETHTKERKKKDQVLLPLRLFQFKRRKVRSADMHRGLKHEM